MGSKGQAAVVIPFDPEGKALLLRRGPTAPWWPGRWNFPGGLVDPGETVQAAALRELREESGIVVPPEALHWAFSYRRPGGLTHLFWVKLASRPAVKYTDNEHDGHIWRHLHQIPSPAIPGLRYVVQQITQSTSNLASPKEVALGFLDNRAILGDSGPGGSTMPSRWKTSDYLANWPKFEPFPYALTRGRRPVPNSSSVDWPKAQFAPLYLSPGSPSFQPYSYLKNDVPLCDQEPHYTATNHGPYHRSNVGPGGDLARLPHGYGGTMSQSNPRFVLHRPSTSFSSGERDYKATRVGQPANYRYGKATQFASHERDYRATVVKTPSRGLAKVRLAQLNANIRRLHREFKRKGLSRRQKRRLAALVAMRRALRSEMGLHVRKPGIAPRVAGYVVSQAKAVERATSLPAPSLALPMSVTRWGLRSTSTPIASGIPSTASAAAPPSSVTPEPRTITQTRSVSFGDGFAYELAPLTAEAPYAEHDLGDYSGDCGCAKSNPDTEDMTLGKAAAVGLAIFGAWSLYGALRDGG